MNFDIGDLVIIASPPLKKFKETNPEWYATQLELYTNKKVVKIVEITNNLFEGNKWFGVDYRVIGTSFDVTGVPDIHLEKVFGL